MTAANAIWAFIPAGGLGRRMNAPVPKQYLPLLGRPVILHTLERLVSSARVQGVMVGIASDDAHWPKVHPELKSVPKFLGTSPGGETRAHTVLNGLKALASKANPDDWVLVHDAVRPCVRVADIDKLIQAVSSDEHGGLLAQPVSDTVKQVDQDKRVVATIQREGLWRAATPQMFRIRQLQQTLEQSMKTGAVITDEASAMEQAGFRPKVVACHPDNIKITLAEDFALAELFLKQQQGKS